MIDGMNTHGLFVGTFSWKRKQYNNQDLPNKLNLYTSEINYLLKTCSSINDVKNFVKDINIKLTIINNVNFSLHWMVCDTKGKSVIIEVLNGNVMIYENL